MERASSPTHLRDSFHGFLARCRRQRPRVYLGLCPCSAGSRSGGWSSPGSPFAPQCCHCRGAQSPSFFDFEPFLPLQLVLFSFSFSCFGLLQPRIACGPRHLLGSPLLVCSCCWGLGEQPKWLDCCLRSTDLCLHRCSACHPLLSFNFHSSPKK